MVPSSAEAQRPAGSLHDAMLQLQRSAGNRALADRLAQGRRPVQRLLTTTPGEFDKHISTGSRILGAGVRQTNDQSPFEAIRKALADYHTDIKKSKGEPELSLAQQKWHLENLDYLCQEYLGEKPLAIKKDMKRHKVVDKLAAEVSIELVAFSRREAEKRYQDNISNASPDVPVGADETDPAKKFGFRAMSDTGQLGATNHSVGQMRDRAEKIQEEKEKYGLSDAEISAITVFSAQDFNYINPATANSPDWMESNKAKAGQGDRFQDVDDKTIKEEGTLHTAMAMQGLNKMPRYKGESYRGARYTPQDFAAAFVSKKKLNFTTLASSSTNKDIALDFAHGVNSGTKPKNGQTVAVITVLVDTGVDISNIAMIRSEAEVLILAGSWFEVTSLEPVDGNTEYAKWVDQATRDGQPLPTKWYVAKLTATEPDAKQKVSKWGEKKSATGSNLPITAPIEEYLEVRKKAGRVGNTIIGGR